MSTVVIRHRTIDLQPTQERRHRRE
jgi:hypothetical protein